MRTATYIINLKAPFFLVQALVPHMVERGSGVVVNILTGAAHRGSPAAGLGTAGQGDEGLPVPRHRAEVDSRVAGRWAADELVGAHTIRARESADLQLDRSAATMH